MLTSVRARAQWMDALEKRDLPRIRDLLERLPTSHRRTGATPGATPLLSSAPSTPASIAPPRSVAEGGEADSVVRAAASLSLDQFLVRAMSALHVNSYRPKPHWPCACTSEHTHQRGQ